MKTPITYTLPFILLIIFSCSSADDQGDFLKCLKEELDISDIVYTPSNSSYPSILGFSIQNLRFTSDATPKPLVIITPERESHIPPVIYCGKRNGMEIRTRGAGHDYEGLSYVSKIPFVMIDLIKLSQVEVDAEAKTAWVEAGATLGTLYYKIAEKSPILGFAGGICPTVGVGGHFSGGGYGTLLRKYGLAADHVIDARMVDVSGRILDKKSMGEDLFWAIRGGGGASFGVITAWKVQLVDVPKKVTVFKTDRTLEKNSIELIHRWQHVAPRLDKDLFIRVHITRPNMTITANFKSIFLGGIDRLLSVMQQSFPELGLVRGDCTEMSWIQSTLYFNELPIESPEVLLKRTDPRVQYFKSKSDYVQKPIPKYGLKGIWKQFYEPEARLSTLSLVPYGGKMDEIPESSIPFPHRAGNLYHIQHMMHWQADEVQNMEKYIDWTRKLFAYMALYVSKNPRAAYINFRDLDIGVNNNEGPTSYEQASIWGVKYFKSNFDRLVAVKTMFDPENFFRNEQSIPPMLENCLVRSH